MTSKSKNNNEPITRGILNDAVDVILEGMDKIAKEIRKDMGKGFRDAASDRLGIKRQIRDLKHSTVEIKNFEKLKATVVHHHPVS